MIFAQRESSVCSTICAVAVMMTLSSRKAHSLVTITVELWRSEEAMFAIFLAHSHSILLGFRRVKVA